MISVIVPCYNEEDNVDDIYTNVSASLGKTVDDYEIIFVDDGSSDSTLEKLKRLKNNDRRVVVVEHAENRGLGKALETGFRNASGDVIVTTDADSTHDPTMIPKMAGLIKRGYDVVIGSRYVKGGKMLNVPPYRVAVSMFAGFAIHAILGLWGVKDITSGYRAYSKMVKRISVQSAGFQSELEIIYKMSKLGAKMVEVPIVLEMRKKGNSKFRLFKTAKEYLWLVARMRLNMEK